MKRKKWEKLHGFYTDNTGELYCHDKSCYDCRHVFTPVAIDIPRICGEMVINGVKDDAEVYKDSTCKHFL
jgi:hypothetical protein